MNLSLLFDFVDVDEFDDLPLDSFFYSLFFANQSDFNFEEMDIALLSIDDNRGTQNHVLDCANVRKELYGLKQCSTSSRIVDLGTLRPGPEYSDTQERLGEVLEYCLACNVIPVVINSSQDIVYQCYKSLINHSPQSINIAVVDRELDINDDKDLNSGFISQILSHSVNRLRRFKSIAYQSFLVNESLINVFQKLSFEQLRLGAIKKDVFQAEIMVRNSQIFSFDLGAIKSNEFPANGTHSPYGLTAEEACQIVSFAGHSSDVKIVSFSNYYEDLDDHRLSSHGLAAMIWYFILGRYTRVNEDLEKDTLEFIVENDSFSENVSFLKGKLSNKWWLKLPNDVIPCSYQDYLDANNGILPDLLIRELGG